VNPEGPPPERHLAETEQLRTEVTRCRQREQSLLELLEAHERERRLVAYEIHDGLAQLLTGALYRLQEYRGLQATRPDDAQSVLDECFALLERGVKETRRLIRGLRPPTLDEAGVGAAIAELLSEAAEPGGPVIDFHNRTSGRRWSGALEYGVFRMVQETLSNARRHSRSSRVQLDLVEAPDRLRIEVRDWGVGFDPAAVAAGRFGLEGIRERARLLGGRATIDSRPGAGTRILIELPLPAGPDLTRP
jgi:signal transduction histidine kinase